MAKFVVCIRYIQTKDIKVEAKDKVEAELKVLLEYSRILEIVDIKEAHDD